MIEKETNEKKLAEKTMSAEMVEVHVRLYQPFYNFIKKYLAFFGSKRSIEDFCRQAVYDRVSLLYKEFEQFVSNKQSFIDSQEWSEKWPHISIVAFEEPE